MSSTEDFGFLKTLKVVGVLGTGVPRLACLQPKAWLCWQACTAHLHQQGIKTLTRGQASQGGQHKNSSGEALPGWVVRGGEFKAGQTSRGSCDVSHDDRDQVGARRAPARAASLFPLWCQGGKRRRGVPRHQAKDSISVQRDQDQQDGKTEVTMDPKAASPPKPFAGEDCFCQDSLY